MLTTSREPLPELDAKVDFLSAASSYERTTSVEVRETHMSWVFLTDCHAFKLKKPIKTSFLDFSTLARRRRFCEEEVRLNESLAPGIYLDVVPLGIDSAGRLQLGEGKPVDYLVRMVRLPAAATLDAAIRAGGTRENDIRNLAKRLAAFYRDAPAVPVAVDAYRRRISADVAANAEAMLRPSYGLPAEIIQGVAHSLATFVETRSEILDRRVQEHRIVDAHGDLRPEHVYFLPDRIAVVDRLEFNAAFRELDPADELAYLVMECDHAGAPSIGPLLIETYVAETNDRLYPALMTFYKCARAMLRAKLAIWHLDSSRPRTPEKWLRQAKAYLDLARGYASKL